MRHLCLLLLLGTAVYATPAQFVDEWSALGMPLYGQQSVALVNGAPAALKGELPVEEETGHAVFDVDEF